MRVRMWAGDFANAALIFDNPAIINEAIQKLTTGSTKSDQKTKRGLALEA